MVLSRGEYPTLRRRIRKEIGHNERKKKRSFCVVGLKT
jgi:hypothetical protein